MQLTEKIKLAENKQYEENQKLKKQLAEQNKIVKENIKSEEEKLITKQKLEKQQKLEEAQLERTKQKLLEQGRVYVQLNQQLTQSRKYSQDLASQLVLLEQNGKRNTEEYKRLSLQLTEANKKVNALDNSIKTIDSSVGLHQRNVGNYGLALKNLGSQLVGAFGIIGGVQLFASVVQSSVKVIKDFDASQAELSAILGVSKSEMKSLKDLTLELGATTSFTANQTTKAGTELAKLGFTMEEIKASLKGVLDGAVAMGTSIDNSASLTAKTLRAFGLDASESERVVSVLAASTNKTATSFDYLNDALPYASTGAKQLGLSVEQTTALIGLLADRGLQASTAGTSLRDIFADLSVKGLTLEEAVNKINNSTDKTKTSFDIFGKTSLNAGIIIAENFHKFEDLTGAITNQEDALKKLVAVRLDTLEGDMKLLESAWEGLILSIESGDGILANISRGFIQMTTDLLGFLTVQKQASKDTKNEQLELNILVSQITSLNEKSSERKGLILELKKNYPGFLRYLDLEKASNKEITDELNNLNNEYVKKIALQKEEEKLKSVLEDQASLFENLADKQKIAFEQLNDLKIEYGLVANIDFNDLEGSYKRLNEEAKKNGKYTFDITGVVKSWISQTKTVKETIKEQNKEVEKQKESYNQTSNVINKAIFNVNNLKSSTTDLSNETLKELENWRNIPNVIERATAKARLYKITQAKALSKNDGNFVFDNAVFDTKKGTKLKAETENLKKSTNEYISLRKKAFEENKKTFEAFDFRTGKIETFDTKKGGKIKKKVNPINLSNNEFEKETKLDKQSKSDKIPKSKEPKLEKIEKSNPLEKAKLEIEAQRLALEYKIQSYKQEENLAENNLTFLEMVRQEKLRLLKEEKDVELQKEGITAQEKKNINAKYQIDVLNIDRQAKEDKNKLELDAKNLELETFKIRNASVLENAKTLTQELVRLENERINKIIEFEKNKLAIQYQINKQQLDDKIATNQKLTENEQKYYNEITQLEKDKIQQQYENNLKLNESLISIQKNQVARENQLLDEKYKATDEFKIKDLEKKASIEREDLENKQTAEIEKLTAQNEAKLLSDEDFLSRKSEIEAYYKDEQKTIDEEEDALKNELFENNLLNQAELLGQSFEKGNEMRALASSVWAFYDEQDKRSNLEKTANVLGATADLFGKQTALGKAFAIGQATLNTYQAFTNALANTPIPPPGPQIAAGLTLAVGLAQVAKIVSYKPPKYADGTLNAPENQIAITDEQGPELHFDKKWKLKDFGSDKGARFKEVKKGDKILPADITSMILKTNLNEIKQKPQNFDFDKLGDKIVSYLNKKTNKHYFVIDGQLIKVIENDKEEHIIFPNNRSFFKQELF